jgi:hypothetical protein
LLPCSGHRTSDISWNGGTMKLVEQEQLVLAG